MDMTQRYGYDSKLLFSDVKEMRHETVRQSDALRLVVGFQKFSVVKYVWGEGGRGQV